MIGPLQLWAGPECTVNRVGDAYRDQLEETGFAQRLDDLDRIAGLGIQRIRLPLLWERSALGRAAGFDFRWADARIDRMQSLGLLCIAGLLHHGSGPRGTQLLDPAFPEALARYARAVAQRYPHLDAYTPINEPLTTARFSALYGIWYPHHRSDASFLRALLNQVLATRLAMREIRRVNPAAQLVQTDDLGITHATPPLRYQAEFENARRWLAFDLLCGRVVPAHPLWAYLLRHGIGEAELNSLADAPCPPDVVGVNHYVTSDRFLDDRIQNYPVARHGGNGRHRYVDVESVRVLGDLPGGMEARIREAWQRYRLPVAVTEVHLGCSREEQLRWLTSAWRAAQRLRAEGADIRAVTVWAAFGTMDWDSLLCERNGTYEPGMWDARSDPPRPTALAATARQLAQHGAANHPVLESHGWWMRPIRHLHPVHGEPRWNAMDGRAVLISGALGTLGRAFARLCHQRGLPFHLLTRQECDIAEADSVRAAIGRWQPWAWINATGFVRVDEAERDPRQWRDNVIGPATLAEACAASAVRLVTFSSDLVFDGLSSRPYLESAAPAPLNAYGLAKAEAERRVLRADPAALVVRSAAFFGPWDRHNFLTAGLGALREGRRWRAAADQVVSPTYVCDLVNHSLDLLIDGECGIWHLANRGAVSWYEFALMAARAAGLEGAWIEPVPGASLGQTAARPARVALDSERGQIMPPLAHALARYVVQLGPDVLPDRERAVDLPCVEQRVA